MTISTRRPLFTALMTLAVTLVIAWFSVDMSDDSYVFPGAIAILMVVMAVAMLIMALKPKPEGTLVDEESIPWGIIFPTLVILIGFLVVVEWLGFFVTSFLSFYGIVLIYTRGLPNVPQTVRSGLISLAFTGALYLLFVIILGVQFPKGILI